MPRITLIGHRTAFEAGIEHRDVSEGNVMIANGRGFLHDFDYAFNWKAFLYSRGFEDTVASWEEYVRTRGMGIRRRNADTLEQAAMSTNEPAAAASPAEGVSSKRRLAPPLPVVNKAGHKEYFVDGIIAERLASGKGRRKEYLVRWKGYPEASWESAINLRRCEAFLRWKALTVEERADLSKEYVANASVFPATDERAEAIGTQDDDAILRDQRRRSECKERTVSRR